MKTSTLHKWKVHITKKGRAQEFQDKGKIDVMDFWEQKQVFLTQVVGTEMIFLQYLRSLGSLRKEEDGGSALHKETKNNEVIFSYAWNIIFTHNLNVLVLKFLEIKNMVFLSQKVDVNMILTDY